MLNFPRSVDGNEKKTKENLSVTTDLCKEKVKYHVLMCPSSDLCKYCSKALHVSALCGGHSDL